MAGTGNLGIVVAYQHQISSNSTAQYFDNSKSISNVSSMPSTMLRTWVGNGGVLPYNDAQYNNFYIDKRGNDLYLVYNCELCHPINPSTGRPASGNTSDWGPHDDLIAVHDPPEINLRFKLYTNSGNIWQIYDMQIWGAGEFYIGTAPPNIQAIALGEIIGFDDDLPRERDLAHPPPFRPEIIIYGNQNEAGEYIHQASGELIDPTYPSDRLTVIVGGITYEVLTLTAQVGSGQNVRYPGESLLRNGNLYYYYAINANGSISVTPAPTSGSSYPTISNTRPALKEFNMTQVKVWRKNDVTGIYELWDAYGAWDLTVDPLDPDQLLYWQDIYNALVAGFSGPFEYFYPGEYKIEGWYKNSLTQPYVKLPNGNPNPAAPDHLVIEKEFVVVYEEPYINIDGTISCDPGDFPIPEHVFKNFAEVCFDNGYDVITSIDIYYTAVSGSEILLEHIEKSDLLPVYGVLTFEELDLFYDLIGDYRVELNYTYYTATPVSPEIPGANPRMKSDIFRIIDFVEPSFTITGCIYRFGDEQDVDRYFDPSVTVTIVDPKNIATSFRYTVTPPEGSPLPSISVIPPPPLDGHIEIFTKVGTHYKLEMDYVDECGDPATHTYEFELVQYIEPTWEIVGTLAEYQTRPGVPQYVGEVILRVTDAQGNIEHIAINGLWGDPPTMEHLMSEIGLYNIQFLMGEPCYPALDFLDLEIVTPYPIPMLQLGKNDGGHLQPNESILFDEKIIDNDTIVYDAGLITFLYTGLYAIFWWVAPQAGLSEDGSNYAIITDNGHEIVGSSHTKISQTTGFAFLEVASLGQMGRSVRLVNHSAEDMELSTRTKQQVNLLIFKLGRLTNLDYIHLSLTDTPNVWHLNDELPFDHLTKSNAIHALTFAPASLGVIRIWEPGHYEVFCRIKLRDDSTTPNQIIIFLHSNVQKANLYQISFYVDPVTHEKVVEGRYTLKVPPVLMSHYSRYDEYTLLLHQCGSDGYVTVEHAELWMWQLNRHSAFIRV